MTEEAKKAEFENWQNNNIKWLHFQISIGKIEEVIEKAFLEALNIGFDRGIKTIVNTTTISDAPFVPVWRDDKQKVSIYRLFEETAELMLYFYKHFNKECETFEEPLIWVKRKDSSHDSRVLITGYDEMSVFLEDVWIDLQELFEQYVFLDNSPIGVRNE